MVIEFVFTFVNFVSTTMMKSQSKHSKRFTISHHLTILINQGLGPLQSSIIHPFRPSKHVVDCESSNERHPGYSDGVKKETWNAHLAVSDQIMYKHNCTWLSNENNFGTGWGICLVKTREELLYVTNSPLAHSVLGKTMVRKRMPHDLFFCMHK